MNAFRITIKSHFLAHIGLNARYMNPRLGFCFAGEDYMAKIKLITGISARGNNVYQVSSKTVEKYSRGMELLLRDM